MNLVLFGKFGNWSLPEGTQIILLDNPDDGEYNVNSIDPAQKSRFFNYILEANIDSWVKWASAKGIHEECINFLYKTPEVREKAQDSITDPVSYRVWTMFFNRIAHVTNLNDPQYFEEIKRAGVGTIGEKFLGIFKIFIDNDLGSIPSLQEVFSSKTSSSQACKMLKDVIFDKGTIRNDIKGLLGIRLIGYCSNPKHLTTDFYNKFDAFIKEKIFTVEIVLRIIKDLMKSNPGIMKDLLHHCPSANDVLLQSKTTV